MTIDELVALFHPTYVTIDNPKRKGVPTIGTATVSSFEVDFDSDGTHMYIRIS